MRKTLCMFFACISIFSCLCTGAWASESFETFDLESSVSLMRASAPLDVKVSAHKINKASTPLFLEAGETVTLRISYSPKTASVEFGLIDEDNVFHYVAGKAGTANATIKVPANGSYSFAIRNNSDTEIRVVGYVDY